MQVLSNTISQAIERINIGSSTLFLLLDDGEIESFTVGSRRLIPENGLQRFIARSALIDRINRVLEKKSEPCRVVSRTLFRRGRCRDCGRFFTVDRRDNVVSAHIDLLSLGRELGVLKAGDEDCV